MPTTLPHVLLNFSGVLGFAGNEIWSIGLKMGIQAGGTGALLAPTQTELQTIANGAAPLLTAFLFNDATGSTAGLPVSPWVGYEQCKASAKLASGLDDPTLAPALVELIPTVRTAASMDPASGQFEQYEMSYVEALVVSLLGSTYRVGAASHGRFYVPLPNKFFGDSSTGAPTQMTDGIMDPAVVTYWLVRARTFVAGLNLIGLGDGKQAYVMNISTSADAAGIRFQKVTNVAIDGRPDTVRRRSNALSGVGRQVSAAF